MPELSVTLIKGEKTSFLTDYRDALPVNMYAVKKSILGAEGYMLSYPGLVSFSTGLGIDRGAIYNERFNNHFRISGTNLISVSSTGVVVNLGIVPGISQCRLQGFYSFNTQGIIANGRMFLYSPDDGFIEVVDADLGNPIDGVWIDGYYFLTDGEYIYHTDINNETAINPLKFATAEFMPDPTLGVAKTTDNKVMVFGRYTIEYFTNVATNNFAFTRIVARAQKIGIVATHAKCESKDVWYIVGGRREDAVSVHILTSGVSKKISTREIDKIIKQYTEPELSDIRMECRMEDNTSFILIHLPNETLCFNETIAKQFGLEIAWTILKTDTIGNNPYRAINGIFDARSVKWVYGDKNDSIIGILDDSIVTHYGEKIEWLLYSPFLDLDSFSIDEIEISTIPGHSIIDDATVAFSITSNGIIYSREYWAQYGESRKYGQRFILRRIGYVRNRIGFKFRGVSESKMAFALMKVIYD